MNDRDYWKHQNLGLFKTQENLFKEDPNAPKTTMSDWNRHIDAGKSCTYYINGEKLSVLHPEHFKSLEELTTFIEEKLFMLQQDEAEKKALTQMVLALGYQGGLFHATSSAMTERTHGTNIGLSQPEMRIDLKSTENGLEITENNQYKGWAEMSSQTKHSCIGTNKPYYAQTQTTYLMTPQDIKLTDLIVDCPSINLAKVFDTRPDQEQRFRARILKNMIAHIIEIFFARVVRNTQDEPQVLHTRKSE